MSEMDKGAAFVAKGMASHAKMYRFLGWFFIIIGLPLLPLFGLGLVPIGLGYALLRMAKKLVNPETVEKAMDGIAAVGASLAERAKR